MRHKTLFAALLLLALAGCYKNAYQPLYIISEEKIEEEEKQELFSADLR
ncbi:MAG: hypothetical protein ACOVOR_04110 [Rhabdochlamydiaceae bacterium]